MTKANLENVNLEKSWLKDANLQQANLRGANLSKVKDLTLQQVVSACNWKQAKYNPDFLAELDALPKPNRKVDCNLSNQ